MNYKEITGKSETEEWVLHTYDGLSFVSDRDLANVYRNDIEYYAEKHKDIMIEKLVRDIIESGALQIEYEPDYRRGGTLVCTRLKWLKEK